MPDALKRLAAEQALRPLPEPVAEEALRHAATLRGRHAGVAAVLMYGSCLRGGEIAGQVIDFYVLVDRTGPAYRTWPPRLLAMLDQPNVHYLPAGDGRIAPAKYALMTLSAFTRRCTPAASSSYIWGRFAQPCRIVFVRDAAAQALVTEALASAARTMFSAAAPLLPAGAPAEAVWTRAFAESYRSEPRAEPPGKAAELYRANAAYYDALAEAIRAENAPLPSATHVRGAWARRRVFGKTLAILRIVKSAFTFQGGLDYAIWKIGRHSGAPAMLPAWADRRPRLAKLVTLTRLIRTRAIR